MAKHQCPNRYNGEGARGGCFFNIEKVGDEVAHLKVGHSCVIVHNRDIPVTWLAELIAIATLHEGGIAGFLAEHGIAGEPSYALMCDPV